MTHIILFDGTCSICNQFLIYTLKHDQGLFKVIDQNHPDFERIKTRHIGMMNVNETIYLLEGNQVFSKSTAIARILMKTNLIGKFFSALIMCIPQVFRDTAYRIFARNRTLFQKTSCSIPDQSIRNRLK